MYFFVICGGRGGKRITQITGKLRENSLSGDRGLDFDDVQHCSTITDGKKIRKKRKRCGKKRCP
jgi:hypothetical protein